MIEPTPLPIFEDWSPQMGVAQCVGGDWTPTRRVPNGKLPIHPGAMGIQFAQSIFEGCRAFWDGSGPARLFRIDEHYQRLVASCARLRMPVPPAPLFLEAVVNQVKDSASWTSPFSSETLYIRPLIFGEDDHVMPVASVRTTFVVLTAPLRLFPQKPLVLFAEREFSRSAPGGLGHAKTAANYAHQYLPTWRAKEAGCDAVLWLDSSTHERIEEASTMNIFMVIGNDLVTPALEDTVLSGITRRSIIQLARERHGLDVVERTISLTEVIELVGAGNLKEAFTASTALQIRPISRIVDGERVIDFPAETPWTNQLRADLNAIQRGEADDEWGWITSVPVSASS
ncbi:MAG TPA: branched-chain amino acid aminotransferase [Gemmatimonadetes bacterium]|nr:branched-chain amino acid aminotransferase [Gemmatimonadota bacterium]